MQRRRSRSPVVLPSTELDAHLHSTAAQITKRRGSKVAWDDFDENGPDEEHEVLSIGYHGDDLTSPPAALLQTTMAEAEKAANDGNSDVAIDHWIRCTALARIVYGDAHWMFAKTHIQLAKAYQQLMDLHQQALMHATKGRDILLSPSSHMTASHDHADVQSVYQLSSAHCIIGKALTQLDKLGEAERALVKAEKCSEKYSRLADSGGPDVSLDLDIVTGMGQLSLKQKKYDLAKNCFTKAVDYTKAAHGTKSSKLIPLLRSLATVEILTSNSHRATELLEEALIITKHNDGENSLSTAEILMCLARAHRAADENDEGIVEELIEKALAIYTSQCGSDHEATISCKDELCHFLSVRETSRGRAEELVKEIIASKKKTFGESSCQVGHSYKLLGTLSLSSGNLSQARKCLEKAKHIYGLSYGSKHKETQSVARALEVIAESSGHTVQTKKPVFKTTV